MSAPPNSFDQTHWTGEAQSVIQLSSLPLKKTSFSLCASMNEQVFISGGQANNTKHAVGTVHRIKFSEGDKAPMVEELPKLNVARQDHASCTVGRAIFVFCGTTTGDCN